MAEGKTKNLLVVKLSKKFTTFRCLLQLIHVKLKTSLQVLN